MISTYNRSGIGNIMYRLTEISARFLMKHMWLYYLLSYTWGIVTTLTGWLVLGFVRLFLCKHIIVKGKFGPSYYVTLYGDWGGLELGTNFIMGNSESSKAMLHLACHEVGHTFQNAIYGPFVIFIVFIPSVIRYWYFRWCDRKGKELPDYDQIWFEGSASDLGHYYYDEYSCI